MLGLELVQFPQQGTRVAIEHSARLPGCERGDRTEQTKGGTITTLT